MDMIQFHSIWTVALLVLFVGIWAWAWSRKRKGDFDAAARLPLDDDRPLVAKARRAPTRRRMKNHG